MGTAALGPAGCLCNSCLCTCCFKGISKISGQSDHRARICGYFIIFAAYYGFGVLIMYTFGSTFMKWFERWITCPKFGESSCFGASLIMRVSISLLILYALIWLLMLPKDDFSYSVNKNCWIFKYLMPLGVTFAFFFVDNDPFFKGYTVACQYGGIVYLLFQDLAFNEYFIRFSVSFTVKTRNNFCYTIIYWLFFAAMTAVTAVILAIDFTHNFKCPGNKGIVITNVIIVAVNLGLTFLRLRNDVGFVSTSIYNAYISYYLYSGLSNDTDLACTTLNVNSGWVLSEILINLGLITIIFLLMTFSRELPVFQVKDAKEGLTPEYFANPELRDGTRMHEVTALQGGENANDALDHLEYRTFKFVWLFLCYIFLTMHFLSVITNYGTVSVYKGEAWYLYNAQTGFYIKVVNGFLAAAIYLWTLLAPVILRGRKFGYDEDPNTGEIVLDNKNPRPASLVPPVSQHQNNASQA